LARRFNKAYRIEKVIEVGDTDGVYDENGKNIDRINLKNFNQIKKAISGSRATDVTGGMLHKVEEALALAKKDKTPTILVNGNKPGSLKKAILGHLVVSTLITT
jgi:isopentenyl phosphate kinase